MASQKDPKREYYEQSADKDFVKKYPYLKQDNSGQWYLYENGVYNLQSDDSMRNRMLAFFEEKSLFPYRTKKHASDKLACASSLIDSSDFNPDQDPDIINLKNGLYSISMRKLYPHTPEYVSITQIDTEYLPDAKAERWEQFIDEITLGNKAQGRLLRQFAGYALTRDTSYQKAFMFDGEGSNGKSVFAKVMKELLKRSCSNVSLEQINDHFGASSLFGKTLNIVEEIKESYYHSDVLKKFISGEPVSVNMKYRDNLEFIPTTKFLFCVNQVPRLADTSTGSYRRFIIVPFNAKFGKGGSPADPHLFSTLKNELPGVLNWALAGLDDLHEEGRFTETEENEEAMKSYMYENSPLREMIRDFFIQEETARMNRDMFYEQYKNFVANHGGKPRGMQSMLRELRVLGFETDVAKTTRGCREYEVIGLKPTVAIRDNRYAVINEG